jgi:hypothetical protein
MSAEEVMSGTKIEHRHDKPQSIGTQEDEASLQWFVAGGRPLCSVTN